MSSQRRDVAVQRQQLGDGLSIPSAHPTFRCDSKVRDVGSCGIDSPASTFEAVALVHKPQVELGARGESQVG